MFYIYGCKSKCEVRINPQNPHAIQTPDPDLRSRPIQTSRSRRIQTSRSRPMIQTPLFYVGWTCSFSKYWKVLYSVLQSTTPVLLCTTKYYSVLQSTMLGDLVNLGKIWPSRSRPRSRPFQTSSMESKGSAHSQPCCPRRKTGLCIQRSLSRIWNDHLDSRHSVPDVRKRHFAKVVVPDVRIIAERSRPVYRPMPIYIYIYIHKTTHPWFGAMNFWGGFMPKAGIDPKASQKLTACPWKGTIESLKGASICQVCKHFKIGFHCSCKSG